MDDSSATLADFEARLAAVPWKKLKHAYGSAEDVPGLLLAVARGESDGEDFFTNLWHQGTVYAATAAAVPFLAELAARASDPSVLLTLLSHIAGGTGYHQVHDGLGRAGEATPPRVLARERREVTQAHLAVCRAWSGLAGLLTHPQAGLRTETAGLAGHLYGIAAPVWSSLQALQAIERDPLCRCVVWWSLQHLLTSSREMASFSKRRAWPAPLEPGDLQALQDGLLAQLQAVAADPLAAPAERWLAVELRLQAGASPVLDAAALAKLHEHATACLESGFWEEGHPWFEADPALQLDVLSHRLRMPGLPPPVVVEGARRWQALAAAHRPLRARGVAELVALLVHAAPEVRQAAAGHLHRAGRACLPHGQALWEAGQADGALRTWLLAPLRACGEQSCTAGWLREELQAGESAWVRDTGDEGRDARRRLLRAVQQVRASDAAEIHESLRQGLETWLDHHPPLKARHGDHGPHIVHEPNIQLPAGALDALDLQSMPRALLSRALVHGLPAALGALARRARQGGPEAQAMAEQVRAHAQDERIFRNLRLQAMLELGDEDARRASLAELCTTTFPNWQAARWWARQSGDVPAELLACWHRFLSPLDSAHAVMAAECLWHATSSTAGLLDVLLAPDPRAQPFGRLNLLRAMASRLTAAERERVLAVARSWLARPDGLPQLSIGEDERWLHALRQLLALLEKGKEEGSPGPDAS